MTKTLDEFAAESTNQKAPSGWEPSVTWNGREGSIVTGPMEGEPDPALWAMLIQDWGLDPIATTVDGPIQVRGWDVNVGKGVIKRMFHYKATIKARTSSADRADVEALCKVAEKRRPVQAVSGQSTGSSLVVLLSDWQIGKGEGGGSEKTVERLLAALDKTVAHIKELKKLGRMPDSIYLLGLGDMIEQCAGFYPVQAFSTDLDRRSQKRVARRVLMQYVDTLLQFGLPIVLGAVPGNHGENRLNGKSFTTLVDSDDLALFEEAAEICDHNPERYGQVSVPLGAIAEDLTMTLDISGVCIAAAHGHQIRGGGSSAAQAKIEKWWNGQALGNQPVAKAQILFTGHLHHFVMSEATGRTIIQVPAMDGGSQWWTATSGAASPAGMVVVSVGEAHGSRGWSDLKIL